MKCLLASPRGFEPLTLGLEMWGIEYTNDIVLLFYNIYFTMCLQKWPKYSLLYSSKHDNDMTIRRINFYSIYFYILLLDFSNCRLVDFVIWYSKVNSSIAIEFFLIILTWHFLLNLFKGLLLLVFSNNKVKLKRKRIKWV